MGKIGIFVKNAESIFTNGCVQQGYFIIKSLRKAGYDVTFITVDKTFEKFELLDEPIVNVLNLEQLIKYDTVIFSSLVVNQLEFISYLKLLGIKVIHQMVGNYFILNAEEFVYGVHDGVIATMINQYIDEIWLMPMYKHSLEYIEYITGKPVKISPYVWDDEFIQKYISVKQITPNYTPPADYADKQLDIVIMEPNLSIHKNSLIPLLICNRFFVKHPEKLGQIYLISKPKKNDKWLESIKHLEIVKCNKITPFNRVISLEIFQALRKKGSKFVVLSSNIRNELNFLHLECFVLNIPIIHNCKPYSKNNLFYEDSDSTIELHKACSYLEDIYKNPYVSPAEISSIINQYHPTNDTNVNDYKQLTCDVELMPKIKLQDLLPVLSDAVIPPENIETPGIGIVTYIDKTCTLDVFQKGLTQININLKDFTPMIIYHTKDIDINQFSVKKIRCQFIEYTFKLVENVENVENNGLYLYALGHSPFEKTLFYKPNTIPCFNFVELANKFNDDFIIAPSANNDLDDTDVTSHYELLKALFKLVNIDYTKKPMLDTNFLIFKSGKFKKLCRLIYHTNFNGFSEMFSNLLHFIMSISFPLATIHNLSTTVKLIGKTTNSVYKNYGYLHFLNGVILNIVLDEKHSIDTNSILGATNIRTFTNSKTTVRTFDIKDIKSANF